MWSQRELPDGAPPGDQVRLSSVKIKKALRGFFLYPPNSWKRGRDTFDSLINNAGHGEFAAMTALGRVGVPDDIGPMIASLLRDDNRWVTAQRIEVSGGQTI